MFNEINNPNNSGHPVVDDIFAETDKPAAPAAQSDIETHRVGLASTGETLTMMEREQAGGSKKILKLGIIIVGALVILGGAYFAYSQFFKGKEATPTTPINPTGYIPATPVVTPPVVVPPVVTPNATTVNPIETPPIVEVTSTPIVEIEVDSTADSDGDSLTDAEERKAGTNLNVIDTDNDGLSDYEEVKIYLTNPLSADTDGDSYFDGAEIKSGYNPNGPGKLAGSQPKK